MSKHSARGSGWEEVRQRVLDRDGRACQLRLASCTGVATTVDHLTAVVNGGSNDEANLVAACQKCNASKGARQVVRNTWFDQAYFDPAIQGRLGELM